MRTFTSRLAIARAIALMLILSFVSFSLVGCGGGFVQTGRPENGLAVTAPGVTATGVPIPGATPTANVPPAPAGATLLVAGKDSEVPMGTSGDMVRISGTAIQKDGWLVAAPTSAPANQPVNQYATLKRAYDLTGYAQLDPKARIQVVFANGNTTNVCVIAGNKGPGTFTLTGGSSGSTLSARRLTAAISDTVANPPASLLPNQGNTVSVGEYSYTPPQVETAMVPDDANAYAGNQWGRAYALIFPGQYGRSTDQIVRWLKTRLKQTRLYDDIAVIDCNPREDFLAIAGKIRGFFGNLGHPAAAPPGTLIDIYCVNQGALAALEFANSELRGALRVRNVIAVAPPLEGTPANDDLAYTVAGLLADGVFTNLGGMSTISPLNPASDMMRNFVARTARINHPLHNVASDIYPRADSDSLGIVAAERLDGAGRHDGFVPVSSARAARYQGHFSYSDAVIHDKNHAQLFDNNLVPTLVSFALAPYRTVPTVIGTNLVCGAATWSGNLAGQYAYLTTADGKAMRIFLPRNEEVEISVATSQANFAGVSKGVSGSDYGEYSVFIARGSNGHDQAYLRRHRITNDGGRTVDESWTRLFSTPNLGGVEGDGPTPAVAITNNNGRGVIATTAANLNFGRGGSQVVAIEVASGQRTLLSRGYDNNPANGAGATEFAANADATKVAIVSRSTNLVESVAPAADQIFVVTAVPWQQTVTGRVLASVTNTGAPADGRCWAPAMSSDGTKVAFLTLATNLGSDGTHPAVVVRDLAVGRTTLTSVDDSGRQLAADCTSPCITQYGEYVGFATPSQIWVYSEADRKSTLTDSVDQGVSGAGPRISPDSLTLLYLKGDRTYIAPNRALPQ